MRLDKVINGVVSGEIPAWILLVIVAITAIKSHKEIFQTFLDFKANKFRKLEDAIGCEWVDEDKKKIFKSELSQLHVAEASGIKATPELRDRLLHLYSREGCEVRLEHFQRAAQVLKLEGGELISSIGKVQKVWLYVELVTASIMLLGVLFLVTASLAMMHLVSFDFPVGTLVYFPLGILLFLDGIKVVSLKHVLKEEKRAKEFKAPKELKAAA